MTTKELIYLIKYNELLSPEVCGEIIQRLREHDELRKLACEAIDPLIELYSYLLGISDYQKGDINYGRNE